MAETPVYIRTQYSLDGTNWTNTASGGFSVPAPTSTTTPPIVTPPATTDPIIWSSGAYTSHDSAQLLAMGTWRGRPMGNGSVFCSRDNTAAIGNDWMSGTVPKTIPAIAVAVPMCADNGSIADDISAQITKLANSFKADGRTYYIRLGWEMNLPGWAWHVTDTNLTQWRARWTQYRNIFRTIMGTKALVGFNPNIGGNQSGLTGSILRAWVNGQVDWCGPDAYDCWPPMTSTANIATQHTQNQGLDWWLATSKNMGVPLAFPEWGVSAGTQWAGHCGGDNPTYITEMLNVMRSGNMLFDSYFNEPANYVLSAIYPATLNPKAGATYRAAYTL
jgi:hypothetical protein